MKRALVLPGMDLVPLALAALSTIVGCGTPAPVAPATPTAAVPGPAPAATTPAAVSPAPVIDRDFLRL